MMTDREIHKLESIKQNYKKKCEFCGHTISFYAFENDKKICNYCGKYNYRNDLIKFKIKLKEVKKNG